MPALQSIVLTDRAATPVNHTFLPSNLTAGVGMVVESSGLKVGDSKFSISNRKTTNGRYKATLKLEIPVVQTQIINGISTPVVVRIAYGNLEFSFDEKSTTQERKDLVGMLDSSLATAKTLVNSTVVDLEGVWG